MKIFLGAAPGVGKTYAMLEAAQRARRKASTWSSASSRPMAGRETELLLDGLEVLPRKQIEYRDRLSRRWTSTRILKRRPRLVHRRRAGPHQRARQPARQALPGRRGECWTPASTSIPRSTSSTWKASTTSSRASPGIRVRETVPDSVLDKADEIELIDLPPEDLIERLKQGKVYVKDQATPRHLAFLQPRQPDGAARTGDAGGGRARRRRDAELYEGARDLGPVADARAHHGLRRTNAAVGQKLVRAAQRSADRLRSSWIAVHVADADRGASQGRRQGPHPGNAALAERLGAEIVVLPGAMDVAGELSNYARSRNVSRDHGRAAAQAQARPAVRRSVTQQLVDGAKNFEVLVIGGEDEKARARQREQTVVRASTRIRRANMRWRSRRSRRRTGRGGGRNISSRCESLSIIFVLPVLVARSASACGRRWWPACSASASTNFLHRAPLHLRDHEHPGFLHARSSSSWSRC